MRQIIAILLLAGPLWGAATTVTETLMSPIDGARFTGKIRIDAPVITYSGVTYRNWSQTYTITSSTTFSVALQPNSSSTPYKFTYTPDRGSSWTEYCVVPASGTPVTLTSLGCTTTGAWTNVTVATTQLSGYIQAANFPALTGDVTNSAGSLATTVGKIQGRAVATTAPTDQQALVWNDSNNRWQPGTVASGSGTVTSVALTLPNIFSVSGSPVTTSGTLAASLATQVANRVWAGPTTGADATPTFRALVSADIPANAANTSGNAGTATALAANPADCSAGQYATTIAANGDLTCAQVAYSQLSGTPTIPTIASTTDILQGNGSGSATAAGFAAATVVRGAASLTNANRVLCTASSSTAGECSTSALVPGLTSYDSTATTGTGTITYRAGAATASGTKVLIGYLNDGTTEKFSMTRDGNFVAAKLFPGNQATWGLRYLNPTNWWGIELDAGGGGPVGFVDAAGSRPAGLALGQSSHVVWGTAGNVHDATGQDAGFARVAASVVRVTNGTTGYGRIALDNSTPSAATDACTAQSIWADANYVYVCTASGAIKRAAIATW